MDKKEFILNNIKMIQILDKYGIFHNKTLFKCPFHGDDKHPSAKFYDNSFYCFTCNKTGDIIQFVEYLYNLNFKEGMEKINIDFNLNIKDNEKIDYKKIKEIENRKNKEKQIKEKNKQRFIYICNKRIQIEKTINCLKHQINILNWENIESKISDLQDKLEMLDLELDNLYNIE